MSPENLAPVLLVGTLVLLAAVAAVRVTTRAGLPSLLLYLGLGVLVGESGFGIRFDDAELTQVLGLCALIVILAEGGLTTRWSVVRPALALAGVLATVGVAVSVTIVAVLAHLLLGFDWRLAMLAGAVVSSTDAAAVFATLRRLSLRPRLSATLEAESGFNDAPIVILVVLLSAPDFADVSPVHAAGLIGYELIAGGLVGVGIGVVGGWLLRRGALPAAGLYPLAVVGLTVLAYAVGVVLHASGFLAVYLAGLVLGNSRLPHRRATLGFAEGLGWLAQIGLFVLLGLLVSPPRLVAAIVPALVIGFALVLLARPLSVVASAVWFRVPWREQAFLSWAGLRGAVPIVLATIPLTAGVPGGRELFDSVFVLVVVFTALQGGTLPPLARRLRVVSIGRPTDLSVESAPLEELDADLLQVSVPAGSRLRGVYIDELRLPLGASVTLVVRDGQGFVPGGDTRLRAGDDLLVVATGECRDAAERRLRAVSRG
ncbi:MAG: potassium/proton antiporter, partial [Pseudonocardia sp.]|nr:potassium/proton antiporter [Pseudonocardia sp.]